MEDHHHGVGHTHPTLAGRNLIISILVNTLITIAQVIGGMVSGSLALLSDALHNFGDVVSLVISYIAHRFARKKASIDKTFGFKRAEILAAFVNAATLIVVAVLLIVEAIERFIAPQAIASDLVIVLSVLAIVGNGSSVLILKSQRNDNMNIRAAYLHLVSDMMASVAVLIGGLLMKFYQWYWVDSLLTLAIAIYLIIVGYSLLKSSYKVLMLFTPDSIGIQQIVGAVNNLDQVKNLHHVHIWQLNEHETHLEAHIDFYDDIRMSEFGQIQETIEYMLRRDFKINHVTLQPEFNRIDPKEVIVQD